MIAMDTLLKMTMTESFATLVSRFLLYKSLDSNERVIYMGTFSKSFLPSLRMGYVVLPPHLLKIYQELYGIFKQTVATIQQLAFANFIQSGIGNVTF